MPGQGRIGAVQDEPPGWAGRVMVWLRWVAHVVAVQLLLVLGTLAGGVVLGLLPSLDAAGRLLAALTAGTPSTHVWRDFWHAWRAGLRRLNLLGAPLWPAAALLVADAAVLEALDGAPAAALQAVLVIATSWLAVVLAWLPPVARRYDDTAPRTWRLLLLAPLLGPGTALGVLVVVVVWGLTLVVAPVLAPLVGVTAPLLATGWLVDVRLDRIDAAAATAAPR
ncbi:hypothetical protein Col01nite_05500 [Cellulomonas oligotrophica]|uniref:DUF624 domain-containing protein n=1 Tax=Cellulomonas oligotrophica TaxID=931536 RepID=A0ABQ4D6N7_9CELL|nr:hypothetical protein Col01nite_05500 [Cellulomonas oligotrophica]